MEEFGPPRMTCFSEEAHDATFHFQILCFNKQEKTPSLSGLTGGGANGSGGNIARRLALRTGFSIILATNLPSNAPTVEGFAEKRLLQELQELGYVTVL